MSGSLVRIVFLSNIASNKHTLLPRCPISIHALNIELCGAEPPPGLRKDFVGRDKENSTCLFQQLLMSQGPATRSYFTFLSGNPCSIILLLLSSMVLSPAWIVSIQNSISFSNVSSFDSYPDSSDLAKQRTHTRKHGPCLKRIIAPVTMSPT